MKRPKIRLFLGQGIGGPQPPRVTLERDQAHYLFSVMRLGEGDEIGVFDGTGPEYRARIAEKAGKRGGILEIGAEVAPFRAPPDLWLLFAPIRKERTDFIVEKAAELGVARVLPVATEFTNAGRINRARLQAHAVEAAEQCGGTFVPEVAELAPLGAVLDGWQDGRRLIFADEAAAGAGPGEMPGPPAALLIGPEGGFSEAERTRLRGMPAVRTVALGPRILRADTAAVALMALWQAMAGDW